VEKRFKQAKRDLLEVDTLKREIMVHENSVAKSIKNYSDMAKAKEDEAAKVSELEEQNVAL
jgi:hypothetical protein